MILLEAVQVPLTGGSSRRFFFGGGGGGGGTGHRPGVRGHIPPPPP